MFFAKYVGKSNLKTGFINGNIYICRPESEYSDIVFFGKLEIYNSDGVSFFFKCSGDKETPYIGWEFLDSIYVVIKEDIFSYRRGEVVIATGVEDNKIGVFYKIYDKNQVCGSKLTILNRNNLKVGMRIQSKRTGVWCEVIGIDNLLNVQTSIDALTGLDNYCVCIDSCGDICFDRKVTCNDLGGVGLLQGKSYDVISEDVCGEHRLIYVCGEDGITRGYFLERFI